MLWYLLRKIHIKCNKEQKYYSRKYTERRQKHSVGNNKTHNSGQHVPGCSILPAN
jgi:hypothetical protein